MLDHPEIVRFARIADLLAKRGWAEANAGNLSTRLDKASFKVLPGIIDVRPMKHEFPSLEGDLFLVTATKSRARDVSLMPEKCVGLVEIGKDGKELIYRWGAMPPTSEFPAHLSIYSMCKRTRPDIGAVLHTHPPHIVALSHFPDMQDGPKLNNALRMMHPEVGILVPDGISLLNYEIPGSLELGQATGKALLNCNITVWPMHGVVSIAPDLDKAMDQIEIMEKASLMYLLVRSTGTEPIGLTSEQISESRKFWGIREIDE
jgi:rhamnulose-1-phosphate aldolase